MPFLVSRTLFYCSFSLPNAKKEIIWKGSRPCVVCTSIKQARTLSRLLLVAGALQQNIASLIHSMKVDLLNDRVLDGIRKELTSFGKLAGEPSDTTSRNLRFWFGGKENFRSLLTADPVGEREQREVACFGECSLGETSSCGLKHAAVVCILGKTLAELYDLGKGFLDPISPIISWFSEVRFLS
mmetsp:Transcript_14735/g.26381  ORF Transcript_14735/g.26381 Transcript_14735/m.26381 type:complete len:184 (-) Transcript_14735:960-1511(-)